MGDDNLFIETTRTEQGKFVKPELNRNMYDLLNVSYDYDGVNPKFYFNFRKELDNKVLLTFNDTNNRPIYSAVIGSKVGINYWIKLLVDKSTIDGIFFHICYEGRWITESINSFFVATPKNSSTEEIIQYVLLNNRRMFYHPDSQGVNRLYGLYDLIRDNFRTDFVMCEIGSFSGVSSELFALTCSRVFCVDMWAPYQEAHFLDYAEVLFDERSSRYENITKCKGDSKEMYKKFDNNFFDAVYIDGLHLYDAVKSDIINWLPKIKKNGVICGHDHSLDTDDGVRIAVDEIFGDCIIRKYKDNSWLVNLKEFYSKRK